MSLPSQHLTTPSPALVHSTVAPHTSHWYRLPSWFAMLPLSSDVFLWVAYFFFMGVLQQIRSVLPPLVTTSSDPH